MDRTHTPFAKNGTAVITLCLFILIGCAQHNAPAGITYNSSCITNTTSFEVRGTSMSGIVEPGATVRVLEGYAKCNNLTRGDLAIYNYSGDPYPLIKQVKAIPGDAWHLDGCNIIVNGKNLTTSTGVQYCIGDTRRLALYTHDYPIIPADTYLIMGDQAGGTLDSSVFGLVSKDDIIGKAISRPNN